MRCEVTAIDSLGDRRIVIIGHGFHARCCLLPNDDAPVPARAPKPGERWLYSGLFPPPAWEEEVEIHDLVNGRGMTCFTSSRWGLQVIDEKGRVVLGTTLTPIAVPPEPPEPHPEILLHEEIDLEGWRRRIAAMRGGPVPPRA